jgi:hypothetical protein
MLLLFRQMLTCCYSISLWNISIVILILPIRIVSLNRILSRNLLWPPTGQTLVTTSRRMEQACTLFTGGRALFVGTPSMTQYFPSSPIGHWCPSRSFANSQGFGHSSSPTWHLKMSPLDPSKVPFKALVLSHPIAINIVLLSYFLVALAIRLYGTLIYFYIVSTASDRTGAMCIG